MAGEVLRMRRRRRRGRILTLMEEGRVRVGGLMLWNQWGVSSSLVVVSGRRREA
jgi:hypothetical protein